MRSFVLYLTLMACCCSDYYIFAFNNQFIQKSHNLYKESLLLGKSLESIDDYGDWSQIPGFEDNIPASKRKTIATPENKVPTQPTKLNQPSKVNLPKALIQQNARFKPLQEPNTDWRSSMMKPTKGQSTKVAASKKPPSINPMDQFAFVELDYDDFEAAMMEEEMGGLGAASTISKRSSAPVQHDGLEAGDMIPRGIWDFVVDSENKPFKYSRVQHIVNDLVVVFADPRRMTEDFKTILEEFKRIPASTLKISLLAINCDVSNDHRKYLKKGSTTMAFPMLTDPSKKLMDELRCRGANRICSALCIMEISTGTIQKIWYENDWDPFTTRVIAVSCCSRCMLTKPCILQIGFDCG